MAFHAIDCSAGCTRARTEIGRKRPRAAPEFRKRNSMRGLFEPGTATLLQERERVHEK